MINILFFVLIFVTSSASHRVDGMHSTLKEDMELEKQLKLINKSPVKSIQTKFGYTIDCVDINKQPTFDHPLLKNHKLQRKPSFQRTIEKTNMKSSPTKPIFGLENNMCPTGTVPIRRITKSDIVRAKSLLNNHILTQDSPGIHVANVSLITIPGRPYYGVSGTNSIYNPRVYKDQESSSHVWVKNGQGDGTNQIVVGWHVSPELYGNDSTYVFSLWTSDNFKKTGCYNVLCPGFVQVESQYHIGGPVVNTSVYGGLMYEMPISLQQASNITFTKVYKCDQDPITKNWWVIIANKNVGYFPAALFSNMTSADQVGWGGRTKTPAGNPSPPMGSGYLPDDNYVHACYFRKVAYQNASRVFYEPEIYLADTYSDVPKCYGVEYYGYQGKDVRYALQFGGPGGDCGN